MNIKNINIKDINIKKETEKNLTKVFHKAADSAKEAKSALENLAKDGQKFVKEQIKEREKNKEVMTAGQIDAKSALKIIYYLMAVDGTVFHSEEEKFDAIGAELDPDFAADKERIIKECQIQLEKINDEEDHYDVLQEGVEDTITSAKMSVNTGISIKLLLWDLLAVAYSDDNYSEIERKLIKYVVRKLELDKAVFLEMESSVLTIMDLEKEISWIKTTDRPYLTIEKRINELNRRKEAVFESVKYLITI